MDSCVKCSLSGRTTHRRDDFILFRTESTAFFKKSVGFHYRKSLLFFPFVDFFKSFPEHMESKEKPPIYAVFCFHRVIKKSPAADFFRRRTIHLVITSIVFSDKFSPDIPFSFIIISGGTRYLFAISHIFSPFSA